MQSALHHEESLLTGLGNVSDHELALLMAIDELPEGMHCINATYLHVLLIVLGE